MCHEDCPYPIAGGDHLHEQDLALPVDGGSLPIFLAGPERFPAPAVMIIHDIYGPNAFYQDIARRLAAAGFLAALPDFFFRQGPIPDGDRQAAGERIAQVRQEQTLSNMQATLLWLRDHESGNDKIGTTGMCWGGSMVMLSASHTPTPDAVVPFYGFPVRERTPNLAILPIDETEVTGIASPMLGFWGERDQAVGIANVHAYDEKLRKYDKPHEFVFYPKLGHAFMSFDPASDAYDASQDAWQRTLAFLGTHLELRSDAA